VIFKEAVACTLLRRHIALLNSRKVVLTALFFLIVPLAASGIGQEARVEYQYHSGDFSIVKEGRSAPIYVDPDDYPGVARAAKDLQADVQRVTGNAPLLIGDEQHPGQGVIIVGTLGKSGLIDRLASENKLDVSAIRGKWESFLIQAVRNPLPGVSSALVIAGSDKRGTIFGVYDVSEQIGVSPWYWWADVAVHPHKELFVRPGPYLQGPPAVKYRGIFLNDEAPALSGWVKEKYGSYNHEFYVRVFELLLRLKANYLWPAMWGSAFNEDDPLNAKLADEYGIVMGTSHHEPMLRAQQEWKRHGAGPWDYTKNSEVLREFWDAGIERNKNYESIVTLGMRGDGDLPMSASANTTLLEQIVADQRGILVKRINPDVSKIPQDWALYKEVQEYYEKGMRVPDDVTLLWCDDNWGNIRRLPTAQERSRSGGAGIYYHFDYVGDPRSYKWINTNPIAKVWEQMNLAYHYGADRIWIVNVGDLKPMEFPIEFFLALAWRPENWPKEKLGEYTRLWAAREFGDKYASEIAEIIVRYTKYNGRRKPELLEADTFSLADYGEAEKVVADFREITGKAEKIYGALPENQRAAFFELVLYPTKASAIVNELYITAGKNKLYAGQGRARANELAWQAKALFAADAELASYYNHTLAGGKWDHMMDQTHIGYTFWNEPPVNNMPQVSEIELLATAQMAVAVEGSGSAWPGAVDAAVLPAFDVFNRQRRYIDVFNRGKTPFSFTAKVNAPWVTLSKSSGIIDKEQRVWVGVDWSKAPAGAASGEVKIAAAGMPEVVVKLKTEYPAEPKRESLDGFVEADGYVSMEAAHYTKKVDGASAQWEKIDDLGRTLSAMTVMPVTAESVVPPKGSACLEYKMFLFDAGNVEVETILSPTLNFVPGRGLRYAISFDDAAPQVVDALSRNSPEDWAESVKDSVRKVQSTHKVAKPGYHTLKVWMVDPGVALQKIVVNLGGVKPSYLGPPESYHRSAAEPSLR
jgi:Glycosyl hydrolase family 115/Gylcosyl hydrolase family 115 C-terminal domain